MDAKGLWKQFAMSDEGRELAAALESAEDDQLKKQAELDKKINGALAMLAKRMDDKPLVESQKCEAETIYRSRYYSDHCELSIKLPLEMVLELGEMWSHYQDHNCAEAASGLDAFTQTIVSIMLESVPADVVFEMDQGEEEDEGP